MEADMDSSTSPFRQIIRSYRTVSGIPCAENGSSVYLEESREDVICSEAISFYLSSSWREILRTGVPATSLFLVLALVHPG